MRRLFIVLALSVALAAGTRPLAAAAQTLSSASSGQSSKSALAVSPAIIEEVLKPGVTTEYVLRISNLTNFPLPISGTIKNFVPIEELEDRSKQSLYDASQWFRISEPDFILQGNQTKTVKISITPPATAEPGGHYATVYFQPLLPAGALTPATAYLTARVGSLAFLILPGETRKSLAIKNLSGPNVHQSGPIRFEALLANRGGVHLNPNGQVVIRDWRGKVVAQPKANYGVILPGTQKSYIATWQKPHLFGKYTATFEAAYGSGLDKLVSQTQTFWIIPWGLLLGVLLPLTLIVVTALRTRGRWKKAWRILRGKDGPAT